MFRHLVALSVLLWAVGCRPAGTPPPASPAPSAAAPDAPLPSPLPDILARVNGRPIRVRQILPLAQSLFQKTGGTVAERPATIRRALQDYIDRELLFEEAVARGVKADDRAVQILYDRGRVDYPDDQAWATFLAESGFDPQGYKEELRVQETVNAMLIRAGQAMRIPDAEARSRYAGSPGAFPPPNGQPPSFDAVRDQVMTALLEERLQSLRTELVRDLRARARVETYI